MDRSCLKRKRSEARLSEATFKRCQETLKESVSIYDKIKNFEVQFWSYLYFLIMNLRFKQMILYLIKPKKGKGVIKDKHGRNKQHQRTH